jgi:hypothetical protein
MTRVEIKIGDEVIRFSSFYDWRDSAQNRFRNAGLLGRSHEWVCIDSEGRICTCGANFRTATYPVAVYMIDPTSSAYFSTETGATLKPKD